MGDFSLIGMEIGAKVPRSDFGNRDGEYAPHPAKISDLRISVCIPLFRQVEVEQELKDQV